MNYKYDEYSGMVVFIPSPEQQRIIQLEERVAHLEHSLKVILKAISNSSEDTLDVSTLGTSST